MTFFVLRVLAVLAARTEQYSQYERTTYCQYIYRQYLQCSPPKHFEYGQYLQYRTPKYLQVQAVSRVQKYCEYVQYDDVLTLAHCTTEIYCNPWSQNRLQKAPRRKNNKIIRAPRYQYAKGTVLLYNGLWYTIPYHLQRANTRNIAAVVHTYTRKIGLQMLGRIEP